MKKNIRLEKLMIDLNMIKVSQHAKERYAERIMDKDSA